MGKEMAEITITLELFSKQAKKLKNWSAPGKDEVHGYWIKHLTSLHQRMAQQLEEVLKAGTAENWRWMTAGRTTLLMKNRDKGPEPSNYRPITCLPKTYKLLPSIIVESM